MRWLTALLLLFLPACTLLFPIDEDTYEGHPPPKPAPGSDGGRFCAAIDAAFCADFDEGDATLGWFTALIDRGSSIVLDTSLPGFGESAHVTLGTSPDRYAVLLESLDSPYRAVSLELDFYLSPIPWGDGGGNVSIADIDWFAPDGGGVGHGVIVGPSYFQVSTSTPTLVYSLPSGTAPRTLPTGAWTHLRIDAEPKAKNGTVKMWLGTELVIDNGALDFTDIGATRIIFRVGVARITTPTPPVEVRYDNVVFRFL